MRNVGKRFLVTGGCGFIGSNFIRHVYQTYPNDTILNVDALTYAGNEENLKDVESLDSAGDPTQRRYTFVKGDVCDIERVRSLIASQPFDYVIHFAAETHVDRSYFDVTNFLHTNVQGTHTLIEVLRREQPQARFIHISTDEVYGSITEGRSNETAPMQPTNPYAASKAAADLLVQAYVKTHGLQASIVRGSNNYGFFQYPEKLVPLAITNLLDGIAIPLHGEGTHVRSWLHVLDFCNAIDLVARKAESGSIYNVSGEECTNLDLLSLIATSVGAPEKLKVQHVSDRPGSDMRYAPDSTRIQQELGWQRQRELTISIPEKVDWYRQNRDWWLKIKIKKEYFDHYEKQSKGQWY